jgi:Zn-dependent peptidase ImmA (M78 family)
MLYKNINVPFLGKNYIKKKADLFRRQFWDNSIPINIEKIIEFKLKIDIVPTPMMMDRCGADALIASNWQILYIDLEKYMDDNQNRLRFSLGHEIGHFILHKNIYSSFNIQTVNDFYKFFEEIPKEQYGYLETQANNFANYLLVPRERLVLEKKKIFKENKELIELEIRKKRQKYIKFLSCWSNI